MTVLYADSLVLSELAADTMLLLATDRLCGANAGRRLLPAAAIGALYSLLCLLFGGVLPSLPFKGLACAAMLLAAFGANRGFWRRGAVFLLASAAYAGIVLAVSLCLGGFGARQQLLSFAAAYLLLGVVLRFGAARGKTVKAVLRGEGGSVTLTALQDTGSSLRDPLSGAPALVAAEERLLPLFPTRVRALLAATRALPPDRRLERLWQEGAGKGFFLLPYRAVGVESGVLLAFRVNEAELGGKKLRGLAAALAPNEVAQEGFSAVVSAER